MSCDTPIPQAADDAAYYRQVLHEMIDLGAQIARKLHAEIIASAADDRLPGVVEDFERVNRGIRRTILLAQKIARPAPPTRNPATIVARKRMLRELEQRIDRHHGGAEAQSLKAELVDRLDAPDIDDDIAHRQLFDLVDEIARDLGLPTIDGHGTRRTPHDAAVLAAIAERRPPPAPTPRGPQQPPIRHRRPGPEPLPEDPYEAVQAMLTHPRRTP